MKSSGQWPGAGRDLRDKLRVRHSTSTQLLPRGYATLGECEGSEFERYGDQPVGTRHPSRQHVARLHDWTVADRLLMDEASDRICGQPLPCGQ